MTISSTLNRVNYTGNGVTLSFAVSFPFRAQTDLVVLSTVIATGVQTTKTITTHYTITGTPDALGYYSNGGAVLFIVAPASTERITIYRDPPRTQGLDLVANDNMPAETLEAQFDYVTMLVQRVSDLIGRTMRQPDGDSANIGTIPSAVDRASKYSGWDGSSNPAALAAPTGTSITTAFTQTILDDADGDGVAATIINGMTVSAAPATGDLLPTYDISSAVGRKVTIANILTLIAAASTSVAGLIELATQTELDDGVVVRAVTTDLNLTSARAIVSTASGTAFDFSVPAGVRRVEITLKGVSLSGTDNLLIQVGDAGGVEVTGYISSSAAIAAAGATVASSTAGFIVKSGVAANVISGVITLVRHDVDHEWSCSHSLKNSATVVSVGGGQYVGMTAPGLVTVRLTRDGTDTFDAGEVAISYQR